MQRPATYTAALLLGLTSVAAAATFRVSPNGRLRSLQDARDAIRAYKARRGLAEPVRVVIEAGTYTLAKPLVLTPQDSGTAECPIRYEAAPGAKPVFTGGRVITGFRPAGGGLWAARVADVAAGKWYFEQLWVNGRRATRARSPNKFYYYMLAALKYGVDPLTGKRTRLANRAFKGERQDIEPLFRVPKQELRDVTFVAYHSWAVSRHRVAAVDPKANTVIATGPAPWPFMRWGNRQRYHLENFKAALDQPGEWFLDRDGTLYYMPLPGEDMAKAEVVAPVSEAFIQIKGEPALGLMVEHITFKGLAFRHAQYILPEKGHGDAQAAVTIPGAIQVDGARHITFEDCEVGHVGTYGIWFHRGCSQCTVRRCYVHDTGAGGVRMGEGWRRIKDKKARATGHITVDNNIIHSGGRLYMGCTAIWIGHSADNVVTHNDISDFRYTGISVGWVWSYGHSDAVRNKIEFNHIHHIGQGGLSDMGGVYTLGESPGTTVSNNVIHDVGSYDYYGRGGWGLYNDQASTDIVMENNLVYNTKTGNYHLHFGRDLTIRNNIFAFSMHGQIQRSRLEKHFQFEFARNIVIWREGPLFSRNAGDKNVNYHHNLYWNTAGEPVTFKGKTLAAWQASGQGEGSLIADPMFVDADKSDFRLKPGSPAEQIGFKPFDYTKAGLYGDPKWTSIPKRFVFEKVEFAPPPPPGPPMAFAEGFDLLPLGALPPDAKVYTERKGDAIRVVRDPQDNKNQCLRIDDAPGLEHSYNPHFFYSPGHRSGVTTFRFDMMIGERTTMYTEWRDKQRPYRVGPSVWVHSGQVQANGKTLTTIPAGQWVRFEISAGLGEQSTGTWDMVITIRGQTPQRFPGLKNRSPEWKALQWLGFSSMNTDESTFYLDNLSLANTLVGGQ